MTARPVSLPRQVAELARTDLLVEVRAGEVVGVLLPFGVAALLVVAVAVGADVPLLERVGAGVYWAVVLLFGALVAVRQTAADRGPQRDLLVLLGVDPLAPLLARAATTGALLALFAAVLAPVAVALYDPPLGGWAWLLLLIPLVATGLAVLGTLAGALTRNLHGRASLIPLLVVPLAVPLLIGATQVLEGARYRQSPLPWLLLVLLTDLVVVVALVLAAGPLEEAT